MSPVFHRFGMKWLNEMEAEARRQHPEESDAEIARRVAYRIATRNQMRTGFRRVAWQAVKILWAVLILVLLGAIAAKAGHGPYGTVAGETPGYWAALERVKLIEAAPPFDAPIIFLENAQTQLAVIPAGKVIFNCSTNMSCSWDSANRRFNMTSTATGGSNHNLLSATHTDTTAAAVVRGDLMTGQGATPTWSRLAHPANANRFLRANANEPGWAQVDLATADVTGILPKGNLPAAIAYEDESNTFTTGTQDFSGVTALIAVRGTAAPASTACDASGEVGSLYVQSGDPASVNLSVFRCTQTGAASFAWHQISHLSATAPPATCTVGAVFFDTDATAGLNWFGCTAANTWTLLGDGGGGGGGDSIEVEAGDDGGTFDAIDTIARFEDQGDIDFQRSGVGNPHTVVGVVRPNSIGAAEIDGASLESELEAVLDLADLQEKDIDSLTGQANWGTAATKETNDLTISGVEVDFEAGAAEGYPRLAQSVTPPTGDCDAAAESGRLYFDTDADTDGSVFVCRGTTGWKDVDDDGGAGGSPGGDANDVQVNNGAGGFTGESAFEYDLSTNQATIPGAFVDEDLALRGDITPATITADQNDYNPTGLSTASVLRLDADQVRVITGLAGGADGRVIIIYNLGSTDDSTILFRKQNTSSTAANRFAFPRDQALDPGDHMAIQYDGTSSRWRLLSAPSFSSAAGRHRIFYESDFLGSTGTNNQGAPYPWTVSLISSGTQSKIGNSANHQGILRFTSSTTANSGALIRAATDAFLIQGGEFTEFIFQIVTLTNLTFRLGFLDTTTNADATDGCYIEVPSTGAAVGKTASNSTRTTSATIATLATATWYRARIEVDDAAANVKFTIFDANGNQLGQQTNSANIPTGAGRDTGHGYIATNSGTTATNLVDMDYVSLRVVKAFVR